MQRTKENPGLLLAFEGIDGAGKKTWVDFSRKQLESRGFSVTVFEYPDYTSSWGRIIKQYLDDELELDPSEQFFTYFTDIFKDQPRIGNLLSQGLCVIVDRYFTSTIAFQCAKGFKYDLALDIVNAAKPANPDASFFVDVETKIAMQRCRKRNSPDRHERDYLLLQDVARLYRKLVREGILSRKWIVVDGNRDVETLEGLMEKEINAILKDWRDPTKSPINAPH